MTHREVYKRQEARRMEEIMEKQEVTATVLPPIPSEAELALISISVGGFKAA